MAERLRRKPKFVLPRACKDGLQKCPLDGRWLESLESRRLANEEVGGINTSPFEIALTEQVDEL